jgi:hypothetical protein
VSAAAREALALTEKYGVTITAVGRDRLSWQSRGPTPVHALRALKAAKGELIDLLIRYSLDSSGALVGDNLLDELRISGFAVRRYGANAALDDALGGAFDRVATSLLYAFANKRAEYSLALRALRAPDCLEGNAHAALREESAATGAVTDETDEKPSGAMARQLLGYLRDLGFRAYLDRGALYLVDTTGWRRDLFRFISPTLVFEVLNAGLDDDPAGCACMIARSIFSPVKVVRAGVTATKHEVQR